MRPLNAVCTLLFVALGIGVRIYFRDWVSSIIKEASIKSAIDTSQWKPVDVQWADVKFDATKWQTVDFSPQIQRTSMPGAGASRTVAQGQQVTGTQCSKRPTVQSTHGASH